MASVDTSSATTTSAAVYQSGADRKGSTADDGNGFQSVFQNATDKGSSKAAKTDSDVAKGDSAKPGQTTEDQSQQTQGAQSSGVAGTAADTAALSRIKVASSLAKTTAQRQSLQEQLAQLTQAKPAEGTHIVSNVEMQGKKDTQVKAQLSVESVLSKQGRQTVGTQEDEDSKSMSHTATTKNRTTSTAADGTDTTTEPTDLKTLMVLLGNATTAAETAAQAVAAATASGKTQQMTAGAEATADAEPDLKLSQKILALAADGDATVDDATTAAPGTTDPAIDTVFRLSRADGKGGTLDMVIADKKAGLDDTAAASTNAKVENISVLDARRFLAVAGQDNSSAVTQAISQDKDWSSALSSRSLTDDSSTSQATGKVVNTLKIQMHPLDLGQVTATMHLRNDELTVSLRVQTGEAYRQLNQDQDKMIDALRSQGYAVDQITVQLVSTNQQDTQSQNSGQQSRGETGSFQNQGREQQDNNARRQAASGAWQSDDTSSSANGTGTADPSRSGDVYI